MAAVDLNIDLGELPDEPEELYSLATVVNVACGGHAGDHESMARAIALAKTYGATVAAHPSFPDRAGFGRVHMDIDPASLARSIESQCGDLQSIARAASRPVVLVKPHGALYHAAAKDPVFATALIEGALKGLGEAKLTFVGPPRGALFEQTQERGLGYAREGFADRAYRPDGSLVPRSEEGALITEPERAAKQALELVTSREIETLCVHADTRGALEIARAVRAALEAHGHLRR